MISKTNVNYTKLKIHVDIWKSNFLTIVLSKIHSNFNVLGGFKARGPFLKAKLWETSSQNYQIFWCFLGLIPKVDLMNELDLSVKFKMKLPSNYWNHSFMSLLIKYFLQFQPFIFVFLASTWHFATFFDSFHAYKGQTGNSLWYQKNQISSRLMFNQKQKLAKEYEVLC